MKTYDSSTLENGTNNPNDTTKHNSFLSSETISKLSYSEGTDERASGHGSDDSALSIGTRLDRWLGELAG
jgi:hypothetical protein